MASTNGVNHGSTQAESNAIGNDSGHLARPTVAPAKSELSAELRIKRISHLKKFVALLQNPLSDPKSRKLSEFIVGRISPVTKALLNKWPEGSPGILHEALIIDLNEFIRNAIVEEWFQELNLPEETQALLIKRPNGVTLQNLIRFILHNVYPASISRSNTRRRPTHRVGPRGSGLFRINGVEGIYAKVKIRGESYSTPLGTDEPEEARKRKAVWVAKLLREIPDASVSKNTLPSFLPAFFASRENEVTLGKITQETVNKQRLHFNHLRNHWPSFNTTELKAFDTACLKELQRTLLNDAKDRRYSDSKKAPNLSKATYNSYLSLIWQFLEFLFNDGKINGDHFLQMRGAFDWANPSSRKIQMPTKTQFTKMRAYAYNSRGGNGEAGVKFDFLMLCGSRKRTANATKVKHCNFTKGTIKLTKLKRNAMQSGDDEKTVPMLPEVSVILQRWIKARNLGPEDYLFKNGTINGVLKAAAKFAGLENWFHHACRKWFSTEALEQCGDPIAVAELLCHRDGGRTLFEAYRQSCAAHLHPKVRGLKLLPGASADESLGAAAEKAKRAVTKFQNLEPRLGAVVLDHILWIESQVDAESYDVIETLPGHRIAPVQIYVPLGKRIECEPNLPLLRQNLRFLMDQKDVNCADIAIATSIKTARIELAAKTGSLQAVLLPPLAKFFQVNPVDLLTIDLTRACQGNGGAEEMASAKPEPQPIHTESTSPEAGKKGTKTADDLIVEHDRSILANAVSKNLQSILFERNLTGAALAEKSGLGSAILYLYIRGETLPSDASLKKLSQALQIPEAEILDPERVSIVPNPVQVRKNLRAIVDHHGVSDSQYSIENSLGHKCFKHMISTGEISARAATRMAAIEGITIRELLTEDITSKFPPALKLDPLVIARNLNSLFYSRGIAIQKFAQDSDTDICTAGRYLRAEVPKPNRESLLKIAAGLGLSLEELVDPAREVIQVTPSFSANLRHFFGQVDSKPSTLCRGFNVSPSKIQDLCDGKTAPTPVHVSGLCRLFGVTCEELLMKDLSSLSWSKGRRLKK